MDRTTLNPSTAIGATVTASSALLLDVEDRRGALWLTNISTTIYVYLGIDTAAVVGQGICIAPGQTVKMDATGCFSGQIFAITNTSTAVVSGQSFITNY